MDIWNDLLMVPESSFQSFLILSHYSTANELEDILSCDDEVLNDVYEWWVPPVRRLPPLLWVRIQTDLGPYLVERGLKGGTPVLSWYHRQFREAAEEVWRRFHIHARMAPVLGSPLENVVWRDLWVRLPQRTKIFSFVVCF